MSNFQIRVKYDDEENEGVETPSVLPIQANLLDLLDTPAVEHMDTPAPSVR